MKIGIIGGSGFDNPEILEEYEKKDIITPFGQPSSVVTTGKIEGVEVALIARHGTKHQIMPSNVNYRANIWALKEIGCTHIIATTACGSLREEIKSGDLVFLDQFIDRTTKRASSFYDKDKVCHIGMAEPFCQKLRGLLIETARGLGLGHHEKGTVITIEGPRFSTKAESNLFRTWNADVINMSSVPEVVLAREAGICYAMVAMSTDYDCWLEGREAVTIEEVLKVMKGNAEKVTKLILSVLPKIGDEECECRESIKTAIIS
ncbi:S-methyl-5'-thioadenosine phosphorylase [archaeon]|nr:S-methyl-5'-thioadenosine phosphorylase [archaeon]